MDINKGIREYQNAYNAILVDVRETNEYAKGHIPGSVNIPLSRIDEAGHVLRDFRQKIFIYCASGYRSAQAESRLRSAGYRNVENIGGIIDYTGELEKAQ